MCARAQNGAYMFANPTKDSPTTHRGDDYFEVYSPVYYSQYGQVNWDGYTSHTVWLAVCLSGWLAG